MCGGWGAQQQLPGSCDLPRQREPQRRRGGPAGSPPFFAWVHYFDPHFEYLEHEEWSEFGTEPVGRYDQEIAYTDQAIGKVLAKLDEWKLTDNTVVLFMTDNGAPFVPLGYNDQPVFEGGGNIDAGGNAVSQAGTDRVDDGFADLQQGQDQEHDARLAQLGDLALQRRFPERRQLRVGELPGIGDRAAGRG